MLTVFTLQQPSEWDAVVRTFKEYDVYWLSGYVKAFQIHGDGEPLLFFYNSEDTRGIHVVMKRDIANEPQFSGVIKDKSMFDFTSPYGYGGWIVEGKNTEALFCEYDAWLKRNSVVSEFVRFHPMLNNHVICRDYYEVIELGEVVHIDLSSPETIWNNFSSKNRNVIRKAQKNGVQIFCGRYPEIFEVFRQIYNITMNKDHAEEYYYFGEAFFQSLLNDLPHNALVFYAEKEGKVIAAAIMLLANGKMNYHLSGSLPEYYSFAPTNLLLYEAALWGCANGYRTLYLGGGVGSGEDNLYKFKRAFNKGELNHFHIGKRIINGSQYALLLELHGNQNSSFFPEYRA